MAENSKIQWTHHTFNPWRGCTKVHAGCINCYAEKLVTSRLKGRWGAGAERKVAAESTWAEPLRWAKAAAKAGERHRVFCASLADVLDADAPPEAQARLWDLIRQTAAVTYTREELPRVHRGGLDWLLLTKRPERWEVIPADVRPMVWLGTSISDQATADEWVPRLLKARGFALRFLSIEPQVGPVDLRRWIDPYLERCSGCEGGNAPDDPPDCPGHTARDIDWVICGGESGHRARPFNVEWARSLRDQCAEAGAPFFCKQLGAVARDYRNPNTTRSEVPLPASMAGLRLQDNKGGDWSEWPADLRVREFPAAPVGGGR